MSSNFTCLAHAFAHTLAKNTCTYTRSHQTKPRVHKYMCSDQMKPRNKFVSIFEPTIHVCCRFKNRNTGSTHTYTCTDEMRTRNNFAAFFELATHGSRAFANQKYTFYTHVYTHWLNADLQQFRRLFWACHSYARGSQAPALESDLLWDGGLLSRSTCLARNACPSSTWPLVLRVYIYMCIHVYKYIQYI